jgi:quercetin dioxygenase-like cupin family protein
MNELIHRAASNMGSSPEEAEPTRLEGGSIPTRPNPEVVPLGAGKALHVLGDVVTSLVAGADTGGAYAVLQQTTRPGGGPPLHRHSREDEGLSVLAGEYEFWVGEQTFRAAPGTIVFGPRGIPHGFKCLGPSPGRIQAIISPPGLEAFLEEIDEQAKQGPPDMGQAVVLAAKYGVEILGPPPG